MKVILFDFNRTIYDPDARRLIYGARQILELAIAKNYTLYLVSQRENGREEILNREDIGKYFEKTFFVAKKDKKTFQNILNKCSLYPHEVIVVGDRLSAEIRTGNLLGCKTIWIKKGKFARERKRGVAPSLVIEDIRQIAEVL